MNNCKRICLFILMSFCPIAVFADELVIETPNIVAVNEEFKISYSISYSPDKKLTEFIAPVFSDFHVVAGPVESNSSTFIMNGTTNTSTQTKKVTYWLRATKEGVFDLPAAEVKFEGGISVKSQKKAVEVIKDNAGKATNPRSSEDINPDDLFIRMEFNRQSVYKGEPMILSIKLYWHNVPVSSLSKFNMPTLAGFDFQELQIPANESKPYQQKYNNKVYNAITLARLILYPLRAGEITLAPLETVVSVQIPQQSRGSQGLPDLFFGQQYRTVNKQLKSKPVTLNIKDFPAGAPASFNGAMGNFTLAAKLDKNKITANQAVTYSVTVSGTGNFKQINPPLILFPDKFDKYDPKTADNVKISETGGSGTKKFDYVLIPRSAGEFEIPPVEVSYFDARKGTYVTLKSDPLHIEVEKDPSGTNIQPISSMPMVTGKKVEHLGNDILFIKTAPLTALKSSGYVFFASSDFWLLFAAIILIFAIICFIMRKMEKDRRNVALMRNRKANRVAISRLKQSARLLKADDRAGFYEEVARAVWGYISDKLNMQGSEFSRDRVQEKLVSQNVPQENIDMLISVMENCEYARYAPGGNHEGMENMYNEAIAAISKLENLK
ncbi:MAG: BatD family protein [Prevotellaceae bacterium]|nr:BatD family protein [Prevotellaceae bacterium]